MENPVNPEKIMQVGLGFFASKTVLTANNLGLFTLLGKGALSGKVIQTDSPFFLPLVKNNTQQK